MAKSKKTARKSSNSAAKPRPASAPRKKIAKIASTADLKHMAKAPGDYEETGRKFADALIETKFRGVVSGVKLRSQIARGERLAKKAAAAQHKATLADRARMVAESDAWKGMLTTWRMIVAVLPDRADLQHRFAFMSDYMSAKRSAKAPPAAPKTRANIPSA